MYLRVIRTTETSRHQELTEIKAVKEGTSIASTMPAAVSTAEEEVT
jgi:hypothetical protein